MNFRQPKPQTLNSLNPKSETLNPKPCTAQDITARNGDGGHGGEHERGDPEPAGAPYIIHKRALHHSKRDQNLKLKRHPLSPPPPRARSFFFVFRRRSRRASPRSKRRSLPCSRSWLLTRCGGGMRVFPLAVTVLLVVALRLSVSY